MGAGPPVAPRHGPQPQSGEYPFFWQQSSYESLAFPPTNAPFPPTLGQKRARAAPSLVRMPTTRAVTVAHEDDLIRAGSLSLPSLTSTLARPHPTLTFSDIHAIRGAPHAAAPPMEVMRAGASWGDVGAAFATAWREGIAMSDNMRYAWSAYERVCRADCVDPLPVTKRKLIGMWCERVLGNGLKSSGLKTITSRVMTRAGLLGHVVPEDVKTEIGAELEQFCKTYPCEVSSAAPALGAYDGRLSRVIQYAEDRADGSLFFKEMAAILHLSAVLYPRPSALLEGHLRLNHLLLQPPDPPRSRGGLVVRLLLPKSNKKTVDERRDSHPVPMGPAVISVLSFLQARGLLQQGAPSDAIIFPEIDPSNDSIINAALSVDRSTVLLRRHVFIPSGIDDAHHITLRSIRYGGRTDAAVAGVPEPQALAQGGWNSASGAKPYLNHSIATLMSPQADDPTWMMPASGITVGGRVGFYVPSLTHTSTLPPHDHALPTPSHHTAQSLRLQDGQPHKGTAAGVALSADGPPAHSDTLNSKSQGGQ